MISRLSHAAGLLFEPCCGCCGACSANRCEIVHGDQAPSNGLTYADAGVDIDAGNAMVDDIKPLVRATRRPGADAEIGGFGGLFDLKAAGFKDPILVAANDGVGTKVKIAIESGGMKRSASTSWRCASMISWCRALNRCSSWITSPPAS